MNTNGHDFDNGHTIVRFLTKNQNLTQFKSIFWRKNWMSSEYETYSWCK